ncbi:unnamed protein product, partial [Brassica oleracea]
GRALGLDKFQFSFETEAELLKVLENGPYHYKRWMLILQRWEPVVSDQFPSQISFYVRIHGIPLHFWSEGTISTIGNVNGKCTIKNVKEAKIWVEVNGLIPLVMKMEIELPTDDITEVELKYIKIEKHCFTCFSLFHEEVDCPHRHPSALPPKERKLGITQAIALQRIEAEKKRHDDRRGYKRPEDLRSSIRGQEDSYARSGMNRSASRYYQNKREEPCREQSILSRTARPNSNYQRYKAPTMQYRVVETSRTSAGASAPLQNTTPIRTLKERLGAPTDAINGSNSGSKERRSVLERLSKSRVVEEQRERRTPTFESGRLQLPPVEEEREVNKIIDTLEQPDFTERVPATLRLGEGGSHTNARRGEVPIATQSKAVTKRKVTKTPVRKRVVRSPLLRANQKKTSSVRADTSTRRKLVVDKDLNVPCNKAGTSTQRKNKGQPTTVFIPGSTRGGVDFRPHQKSLP